MLAACALHAHCMHDPNTLFVHAHCDPLPQAGMFLWVELANPREPAALLSAMVRLR
tara:strand:- start:186 stop:353 length:168 start_codon:yes stop_codon:yes gene_type:complete